MEGAAQWHMPKAAMVFGLRDGFKLKVSQRCFTESARPNQLSRNRSMALPTEVRHQEDEDLVDDQTNEHTDSVSLEDRICKA